MIEFYDPNANHPPMTDEQVKWWVGEICNRIRARTATAYEWGFLRAHAHPWLVATMIRTVILMQAGIIDANPHYKGPHGD